MSDVSSPALCVLAAKIATSYARANAVPADALAGLIQQAYQGLARCTQPPTPAAPPAKGRRLKAAPKPARSRKG
jgi:predicted transcriptional regulator